MATYYEQWLALEASLPPLRRGNPRTDRNEERDRRRREAA